MKKFVKVPKSVKAYYDPNDPYSRKMDVDDLKRFIDKIEEMIDIMESEGLQAFEPSTSTYGMHGMFIGDPQRGYIDLDDIDKYFPDEDDDRW